MFSPAALPEALGIRTGPAGGPARGSAGEFRRLPEPGQAAGRAAACLSESASPPGGPATGLEGRPGRLRDPGGPPAGSGAGGDDQSRHAGRQPAWGAGVAQTDHSAGRRVQAGQGCSPLWPIIAAVTDNRRRER